jgi:Na+/proline symporter
VYPFLATGGYLPITVAVVFILGLVASTFSSSDSALTALTTSFMVDIKGADVGDESSVKKSRQRVHFAFSVLLFVCVLVFKLLNNSAIIDTLFMIAGYTYGPLLGMYCFGLFTKRVGNDKAIPYIAVASPLISYLVFISTKYFLGYVFGFEILLVNAFLTFAGIYLTSRSHRSV